MSSPRCCTAPQVREYLEKNYAETSGNDTVKLALKALTETVEAGSKNIEVAVVSRDAGARDIAATAPPARPLLHRHPCCCVSFHARRPSHERNSLRRCVIEGSTGRASVR